VKQTTAGDDRGVYGITTAAELTGVAVQTLRLYESRGLVEPARTDGGTRRYSVNDLDQVRRISALAGAGVGLSAVAMVLGLEDENAQLRAEKEEHRWLSATPTGRRTTPPPPLASETSQAQRRPSRTQSVGPRAGSSG
jgi:MerR family transcriptional regulator/heat shock protein HspR